MVAPSIGCAFYRSAAGREPVRDWLLTLPVAARKTIGKDINRIQFDWPIGKPLVDGFGGGLFEVRSTSDKVEYRVMFCVWGKTIVLLHGFKKKSRKAPADDIKLARARQKEVEQ